jgi:hypothetical protein
LRYGLQIEADDWGAGCVAGILREDISLRRRLLLLLRRRRRLSFVCPTEVFWRGVSDKNKCETKAGLVYESKMKLFGKKP